MTQITLKVSRKFQIWNSTIIIFTRLLFHFFFIRDILDGSLWRNFHQLIQIFIDIGYCAVSYEVEEFLDCHCRDFFSSEEVCDVPTVISKEIQRLYVVNLNWLRDINNVELIFKIPAMSKNEGSLYLGSKVTDKMPLSTMVLQVSMNKYSFVHSFVLSFSCSLFIDLIIHSLAVKYGR